MKLSFKIIPVLLALTIASTPQSAFAIDPVTATSVFDRIAESATLRDPSVALIDVSTGELIYESKGDSPRKPASLMKLLSATATVKYLQADKRYATKVFATSESSTAVLQGELDPWFSLKSKEAKKMHRTSVPALANQLIKVAGSDRKKFTVLYSGLYSRDIANLNKYLKTQKRTVSWKKVSKAEGDASAVQEMYASTSPTVTNITTWFLTWSDNVLSERMARQAAKAAGYSFDEYGVADLFSKIVTDMGLDAKALNIHDASGLSKQNRVSAKLMAQLLLKIHNDPTYAQLIAGLPVSGVSGTLSKRYIESAPDAVGLVKAKTGTLNGTVSLAGYIESGDREYIFVVIADRIARGYSASERARKTLDVYLGKIATPLVVQANTNPVITSGSQTP